MVDDVRERKWIDCFFFFFSGGGICYSLNIEGGKKKIVNGGSEDLVIQQLQY